MLHFFSVVVLPYRQALVFVFLVLLSSFFIVSFTNLFAICHLMYINFADYYNSMLGTLEVP